MLANGEQIPEGRTPTAHEHYLTDERFCPEPRNDAANFTALRLRAHHDLVHIPRLHALTLTAEKVGSLANRTDNPTPVANATYECEECQEPAASLFTIQPEYTRPDLSQTSGKSNTYFQIAAAKGMLRDQIAPLRCNSHPATRNPLALREQLIQHTYNKSSAHVCCTCARPVILSIRRTTLGETGPDQQVLFADIHSIATGEPSALPPSDPTQTPNKYPWQPEIRTGSLVSHADGRTGRIIDFAPPLQTPTREPVYFVLFAKKQTTTTNHSNNHYRKLRRMDSCPNPQGAARRQAPAPNGQTNTVKLRLGTHK